jgi:hypothetical protein
VTVWSAKVDRATGEVKGRRLRDSQIDFSDDGHVATERSGYGPATDVYNFDSSGRLDTHVLVLDGLRYRTTRCSYDAQGRLLSSVTSLANGDITGSITQTYGDHTRSTRHVQAAAPSGVFEDVFDGDGRIIQSTARNEATGAVESESHYEYLADTRQRCMNVPGKPASCLVERFDEHGHEIELRSDEFSMTETFEYDATGNWVKRVTHLPGQDEPALDSAIWRDITYR